MATTTTTAVTANFDTFVSSPFASKGLQISNFQKLEKQKEQDESKSMQRGLKMAEIIANGYDFLRTTEAKKAAKDNGITLKPAALAQAIYNMPSSTFYRYLAGHNNRDRVNEFMQYAEKMEAAGKKLRSVGFFDFADWSTKKPTTEAADKPKEDKVSIKFGDKGAKFNLSTGEANNALSLSEIETVIRALFAERKALRKLAKEAAAKKETATNEAGKKAAAAKKAAVIKAGKKAATQPQSIAAIA